MCGNIRCVLPVCESTRNVYFWTHNQKRFPEAKIYTSYDPFCLKLCVYRICNVKVKESREKKHRKKEKREKQLKHEQYQVTVSPRVFRLCKSRPNITSNLVSVFLLWLRSWSSSISLFGVMREMKCNSLKSCIKLCIPKYNRVTLSFRENRKKFNFHKWNVPSQLLMK